MGKSTKSVLNCATTTLHLEADWQTDRSLVQAALREAHEELELPPENVEILGMLNSPEYSLGNKARVWPIVVSRIYIS